MTTFNTTFDQADFEAAMRREDQYAADLAVTTAMPGWCDRIEIQFRRWQKGRERTERAHLWKLWMAEVHAVTHEMSMALYGFQDGVTSQDCAVRLYAALDARGVRE